MDGPYLRKLPRTLLDHPVELCMADRVIRIPRAAGNVNARGLFLLGQDLPLGTSVRVKIDGSAWFDAEGVIRHRDSRRGGVLIEFSALDNGNRECLEDLIAELTRQGLPAC